jgi:hypothetical protein
MVSMSLTAARTSTRGAFVFDIVERVFLLALGVSAFIRLAPAVAGEPQVALILISEGLGVAFILLRKPSTSVPTPRPWPSSARLRPCWWSRRAAE